MVSVACSAEDWEYRGEGNFHVIIINKVTKEVLRLPKCYRDSTIFDDLSSLEAASNELSFVQHIARPAMRYCKASYPIRKVELTKEFLENISLKVEMDRPKHRLQKVINCNCRYGILMPDFCYVQPAPPSSELPTISVEIKPKQGFILKGRSRCAFSESQRKKVASGTVIRESTYCPVDLYSGCKKRMQYAIKSLINNPQNNLRIFKNGKAIFTQEIVNEKQTMNPKDLFKSAVLPILASQIKSTVGLDKFKLAYENFKDILCTVLLAPVCDQDVSGTHTSQQCDCECKEKKGVIATSNYKSMKELESIREIYPKKKISEPQLPSASVLGLLLSIHKLEDNSIQEYYQMYEVLDTYVGLNQGDQRRLSLSGPYDSEAWQQAMERYFIQNCNSLSYQDDMERIADELRKFLIATSFKDCSLMISFQLKPTDYVTDTAEVPLVIKTKLGQEYWASVAVVDSDPKPASRIPQYYSAFMEGGE